VNLSSLKNYSLLLPIFLGITGIALVLISITSSNSGSGVDLGIGLGIVLVVSAFVLPVAIGTKSAPGQSPPMLAVPLPDGQRQQILQNRLSQLLASGHGRIESATPYVATVISGEKVNHVLHLLISVLLCGLWLPVWFLISLSGGEKRHVLTVDPCGNISRAG